MSRHASHIAFAVGIVAVGLSMLIGRKLGVIDGDGAMRLFMAGLGVYVAISANMIPKASGPVSARCLAVRRASGWTLVAAGLGYAVVGLLAPMSLAPALSAGLLAAGVAAVGAYCLWGRARVAA